MKGQQESIIVLTGRRVGLVYLISLSLRLAVGPNGFVHSTGLVEERRSSRFRMQRGSNRPPDLMLLTDVSYRSSICQIQ